LLVRDVYHFLVNFNIFFNRIVRSEFR
jgi:hypothetical protein